MKTAKVLYINITGVSAEVLKNLVLAGIRAVVLDNRPCSSAVASPNVLAGDSAVKKVKTTIGQAMKNKIEELNPLLGDCEVLDTDIDNLSDETLAKFSIVVASHVNVSTAVRLSKATVKAGGKFFLCDTFGFHGACCVDLGKDHTFRPEIGKKLGDPTTLKAHVDLETLLATPLDQCVNRFHKKPPVTYVQYRCLLEYMEQKNIRPSETSTFAAVVKEYLGSSSSLLDDDNLTRLCNVANSEIAPVCSVLGGLIGNEVIKAISSKGEPANNTILFDGITCKGWTFLVRPKE